MCTQSLAISMLPTVRVEQEMAESTTLSALSCYDYSGALKPSDSPCGGWSDKLNSSLCCPDNFQCMRNGLCMLPENITATGQDGATTYPPGHPARLAAAWVQLPTCTSDDW